jgi:hypothetical protein
MAQAAPLQAEAHRATLTAAAARDHMSHPLETTRSGEVRALTITVPLLSERNSYLVVRLPENLVRDVLSYAGTLPEDQRRDYLSEWIIRNQQAVLSQYIQSGRTSRAFRYDVVPARIQVTGAVPRRVEPQQPPVANAVPRREEQSPFRLIEQRHFFDDGRDVVPDGWRAPNRNELPQEVRVRANVLQPAHGQGQIPLGDGRIEEFNGKQYLFQACWHTIPAPRHPGISVRVVAETRNQPRQAPQAQPQAAPRVEQPPVRGPSERPVPRPAPREENREIRSGDGSRRTPFLVTLQRDRSSRNDLSGQEVEIPVTFDVGGRVYFRFNVTLSQIANSKIDQTYSEMIRIARQAISTMPDYQGGAVRLRQDLSGFKASVRTSLAGERDFLRYMDSH